MVRRYPTMLYNRRMKTIISGLDVVAFYRLPVTAGRILQFALNFKSVCHFISIQLAHAAGLLSFTRALAVSSALEIDCVVPNPHLELQSRKLDASCSKPTNPRHHSKEAHYTRRCLEKNCTKCWLVKLNDAVWFGAPVKSNPIVEGHACPKPSIVRDLTSAPGQSHTSS